MRNLWYFAELWIGVAGVLVGFYLALETLEDWRAQRQARKDNRVVPFQQRASR